MKSSNFGSSQHHQHHLQDHVVEHGSCVIPSSMAFPCLSAQDYDHAWSPSPSFFLNKNNIHGHTPCDEATPNSFNNSMIKDMRFSLPNNSINIIQPNPPNEHHQNINISNQIKEESSTSSDQSNNSSFQTFSDMLSPSTIPISQEMLLLNTLSPTYKNLMLQSSPFQPITMGFQENNTSNNNNDYISSLSGRLTTFSQTYPSVNISKLSSSTLDSGSFRGGLDGFSTERCRGGGSHTQAPNSNLLELFKGSSQFGVDPDLQQSNGLKLCNSPNNFSSFKNNGVLEPKRPTCIIVEPKSSHQSSSKKQRFEARASCPPLKVRKEKLGDRVAALQQLVAPFGKTDTASVLMEAIGYIKFLQGQVETLSVPYTKLGSHNKGSDNIQKISSEHFVSEAKKQDLRSKGLCLVPLTCVSYVTSEFEINGEGVWPSHHNYNPRF